jgi:aminoglycoside 6'-N-acetyltransferase I
MKQAAQWATGLGFSELASDTEIDNVDSIARHKRLGFKETYRVVCFLKKLN